jgi:DNA-binding MurR/RpiR family transcriptional regulator
MKAWKIRRNCRLKADGSRTPPLDVLVLFDHPRYEQDKVAMAALARGRGGKVLLFAGPLAVARHQRGQRRTALLVTAPSSYDNLVPTLAVIETVAAGVIETRSEELTDHPRRGEGRRPARRPGVIARARALRGRAQPFRPDRDTPSITQR